jgi:hypothetical protein
MIRTGRLGKLWDWLRAGVARAEALTSKVTIDRRFSIGKTSCLSTLLGAIEGQTVDAGGLSRNPEQSWKAANILTFSAFFMGRHLGHPYSCFASASENSRSAKTKEAQRKIVVLHSGIRFAYYAFTLKNCDRD